MKLVSKRYLIPKDNERDLEDIPENVIADLKVIPVQWIDDVLKVALKKTHQVSKLLL